MEATRVFGRVEDMELVMKERCSGAPAVMAYDWRWRHWEIGGLGVSGRCAVYTL